MLCSHENLFVHANRRAESLIFLIEKLQPRSILGDIFIELVSVYMHITRRDLDSSLTAPISRFRSIGEE